MDDNNQIIIYQSEEGETRLNVKFTDETFGFHSSFRCI